MKKKIYYIVSAILQIFLAVYCIYSAESIADAQKLELTEELKAFAMTSNEVLAMSVINIVLSIVIGIIALKNNVVKRKGTLITIYVICLLTTPSEIVTWISIINIILLCGIKRVKKEKEEKIKVKFNIKKAEETLKVESYKITKKQIVLLAIMFIIYLLQIIPSSFLPESRIGIIIFIVSIYVALFVLAIVSLWKDIKEGFKVVKQNFKVYMKYLVRVLGVMYAFYYLANIATFFATDKVTSVNQETIEMMPMLIVAPIAIIWAPIVEETLFRGALRKLIKNDIVYIIISSVIFGLLHAINEASLSIAISAAIPYMVIGAAFSYMYAKTNNLAGSMIAHSAWNTIGVLLMLIV